MNEQYTEQDSARARMAEQASAEMATRQLSLPSAMAGTHGRGQQPGLMLMGLGAILLLARLVTLPIELTSGMILLTIASVFYFFGFWRYLYGLIIPGSILAGLSVGIPFAELTNGISVLWGLALGFLTIFGLGKTMFGQHSSWPVFPAVILFAVGLIVAITNLPAFLGAGLILAPLLLIAVGIYLGWMRQRS